MSEETNQGSPGPNEAKSAARTKKKKRVNVRRPEVMDLVKAEVERHYDSPVVAKMRENGGVLRVGQTTVKLAQQFGFCYGVERAIDLAYAARRVFPEQRIFLIGEIIHNPEVNRQLREMEIISLPWRKLTAEYDDLNEEDVVIIPAFGAPIAFLDKIEKQGCQVVDTTCGDVMKVWRRVKDYAKKGATSLIHGKRGHEETRATASRALGVDGKGHFLVVLTMEEVEEVCRYLVKGGDKEAFLQKFEGATSPGFDPEVHLVKLGVANQTTMLKSETQAIQERVRQALQERDGNEENFQYFDTICGATQERQDALFDLLREPPDLLLVVGGYNSSNTTHLVEIGQEHLPTYFIRNASCLESVETILHYDLGLKEEARAGNALGNFRDGEVTVGVTAGASCPANLIEETIVRVLALRGVSREEVLEA